MIDKGFAGPWRHWDESASGADNYVEIADPGANACLVIEEITIVTEGAARVCVFMAPNGVTGDDSAGNRLVVGEFAANGGIDKQYVRPRKLPRACKLAFSTDAGSGTTNVMVDGTLQQVLEQEY